MRRWVRTFLPRAHRGAAEISRVGRAENLADQRALVAASGLFDAEFYLRRCPRAAASGVDPIEHFLLDGWRHGIDPGPGFSIEHYLAANADVRDTEVNPLLHYLTYGKAEGRSLVRSPERAGADRAVKRAVAPTPEEWKAVVAAWKDPPGVPVVDVLVPVYCGLDETMRCIFSVLSEPQRTPYRLVVIDDCSPDDDLRAGLDEIAARGLVDLHRTPDNLGFVGACNLGMALHQERDIIMLNSDTEVFGDWLDRLHEVAYRRERSGTVTPLSNNAEICSYPKFVQDNWRPLGIDDAVLDQLAAGANAEVEIEIPTGVGFCMYVRRACLDEIGLFDAEHFGKGYGEENDLCMRAAAAGWRNILAPNIFVRHYGATSFRASKTARVKAALQTVERLHPGYMRLVGDFVSKDPVQACRAALDAARLSHRAQRGAMLFVTHGLGGGTERHVQDMAQLLETNGIPVFFCRVDPNDSQKIRLEDPGTPETPNLASFDIACELDRFARFLREINVAHVHVQHLAGFPESAPDFIRVACAAAGLVYDVTLHDYLAVCPRINLVDASGVYCGEPDLATCEACVSNDGSSFGHPSIWDWRERHARLLTGARRVFVPDADVSRRMRRRLPEIAFTVRPHPEVTVAGQLRIQPAGRVPTPVKTARGTRRIAVLGAIGSNKGSALLADTARAALRRDLSLEFHVVGYTDRDKELRALGNVTITGPYKEGEALDRLLAVGADLAWFPSVCPETYSYTLSTVLMARIYPVAFDLGAIATRIRDAGWGELMPLRRMLDPEWTAERLAELPILESPARLQQLLMFHTYPEPLASYYELPEGFRPNWPRPNSDTGGEFGPLAWFKPRSHWAGLTRPAADGDTPTFSVGVRDGSMRHGGSDDASG
jgi:GT2 family glycosyltransferase/glycosyltransferase involved in cell wall biosynthesis